MTKPRTVYTVFSQNIPYSPTHIFFHDTVSFFDLGKAIEEAEERAKYYPHPHWIVGIIHSILADDITHEGSKK